jgi:hypothetical protein
LKGILKEICMIRVLITLVLAGSTPLLLEAQGAAEADCSGLVARAFEVAGVNDEIAAIPGQIQSQFSNQLQHDSKMSDADKKKFEAAMTQAFLPETIDRELKREFLESCDPGMLRSVIAGLTNSLGERMRKLEAFAESRAARQQGEEYAHTLAQRPPPRERVALMLRMDSSLGITKSTMDITLAAARGIAVAFGGLPAEGTASLQSKETSNQMHGAVLVNLLFTYRDVSDQDLTSYIELYETPALVSFNDRLEKALVGCITRQSEGLGQEIKKMVPPR